MSLKFYMDENVPRQITVGLRLRGINVLTVQEDQRIGRDDPEVLARATELERVLFSRDDDMLALAHERQKSGESFPGVVYVRPRDSSIGECVHDLEVIAIVCTAEDCLNQVQYLNPLANTPLRPIHPSTLLPIYSSRGCRRNLRRGAKICQFAAIARWFTRIANSAPVVNQSN